MAVDVRAEAPAARNSMSAVLPDPRDPIIAISPGFRRSSGVAMKGASLRVTLRMVSPELGPGGGVGPIRTRSSGSRTTWRSVSKERSPFTPAITAFCGCAHFPDPMRIAAMHARLQGLVFLFDCLPTRLWCFPQPEFTLRWRTGEDDVGKPLDLLSQGRERCVLLESCSPVI